MFCNLIDLISDEEIFEIEEFLQIKEKGKQVICDCWKAYQEFHEEISEDEFGFLPKII